MLAVGIHDEPVGEAGDGCGLHGREGGGAFAAIGWQMQNFQVVSFPGQTLNLFHAFIGAPVENDPDGAPDGEDGSGSFHEETTAVETGQNDKVGGIGKRSGRGQRTEI